MTDYTNNEKTWPENTSEGSQISLENEKPIEHTTESTETKAPKYASTFEYQNVPVKMALFILWRIHNKKYQIGSRIFFEEVRQFIPMNRVKYNEGLLFLDGAGMAVNEVVVVDKLPTSLIQRYGILTDE